MSLDAEYRDLFNLIDRDNSGLINKAELVDIFMTLGLNCTEIEVDMMFQEMDSDGDGGISFQEFLTVMGRKVPSNQTPRSLLRAFRLFADPATPGQIAPEALMQAVKSCVSEAEAKQLIGGIRPDPATGLINYVELVKLAGNR